MRTIEALNSWIEDEYFADAAAKKLAIEAKERIDFWTARGDCPAHVENAINEAEGLLHRLSASLPF